MHAHWSSALRQHVHVVGITLSAFHLQSLSEEQHSQAIARRSLPSPRKMGAFLCLSLCTVLYYFSCTVSSLAML